MSHWIDLPVFGVKVLLRDIAVVRWSEWLRSWKTAFPMRRILIVGIFMGAPLLALLDIEVEAALGEGLGGCSRVFFVIGWKALHIYNFSCKALMTDDLIFTSAFMASS